MLSHYVSEVIVGFRSGYPISAICLTIFIKNYGVGGLDAKLYFGGSPGCNSIFSTNLSLFLGNAPKSH